MIRNDDRRPSRGPRPGWDGRRDEHTSPTLGGFRQGKPKRSPRWGLGPLSAWAQQAERWKGPTRAFKCCGTLYRAMTDEALAVVREKHNAVRHPAG